MVERIQGTQLAHHRPRHRRIHIRPEVRCQRQDVRQRLITGQRECRRVVEQAELVCGREFAKPRGQPRKQIRRIQVRK